MKAWLLLAVLPVLAAAAQALEIHYDPADPDTSDVITFSTDATGDLVWDFDDGNQSIGRHVQHRYHVSAYYHVTLRQDGAVIAEADVPVKIPAEKYMEHANSTTEEPPVTPDPGPVAPDPEENSTEAPQGEPVSKEKDPLSWLTNPMVIGALALFAGGGYVIHQRLLRAKDKGQAVEDPDDEPPADPADRIDERDDVDAFYADEDYDELDDDEADAMPPQAELDEDMDMADEDELGQTDPEPVDDPDDTDDAIDGPGVLGGQG